MLEEVKEKDAIIQNLEKVNQTYQNEINNLKTQILKLKIEIDDCNFQLKLKDSQNKMSSSFSKISYNNLVQKKENELSLLMSNKSAVNGYKETYEKVKYELKAKDDIILTIKNSVVKQREVFLQEKEYLQKMYEEKCKNKENEIKELNRIINDNTELITNCQFENSKLQMDIKAFDSKYSFSMKSIEDLKKENLSLIQEKNKNISIIEENERITNELKTQNEKVIQLKNENRRLNSSLKQKDKDIKDLQSKLSSLEEEILKFNKSYEYYDIKSKTTFTVKSLFDITILISKLITSNSSLYNKQPVNKNVNQSYLYIDSHLNQIEFIGTILPSIIPQSESSYIAKINQLESSLTSAKNLIASLKESNEQQSILLKQKTSSVDISSYTKLQNKIVSFITSIAPTLISLEFTSNDISSIPVDKYIELINKFSESLSKKESKTKKYKEMLQKLSRMLSEQKKEISSIISNKKEIINLIQKFDTYISTTVKDNLTAIDFESESETKIIEKLEVIFESLFNEEETFKSSLDALLIEDTAVNESFNKSFITNSSFNDSSSQ